MDLEKILILHKKPKVNKFVCHKPENAPAGANYAVFTTRAACVDPSAREEVPLIPDTDLTKKDFKCCRPAGGKRFSYGQFHNKKLCEIPCERCPGACKRAIDGKKGNKAAPKNTESVDESVDGKKGNKAAPKNTESVDESVDENEDFTVQGENRNEICVQRDDVDYSQTVKVIQILLHKDLRQSLLVLNQQLGVRCCMAREGRRMV